RYNARFSYLTSWAGGTDFRSFRSSSADDSGGMSESSTQPTLQYFYARLGASPWRGHQLSFSTLQSLDSAARRTVVGRSGRGAPLPGRIFSARYSLALGQGFSLGLGQTYVGDKFSDPSLGLTQRG